MVGRLDQKQTIPSAVSSNLTHQVEPVEVGDCLGLRQHTLRESLKSASPIGSSIRYANNTLGTRLSKLRLERKHYKNGGRRRRPSEAAADISGTEAGKFQRVIDVATSGFTARYRRGRLIGKIITTVWVKSHPAPTADAAASIPPATPDPAARAATRDRPDDHRLGLHDPVVEGARCAGVERHGLYRFRACGQTRSGDGGPEQKPARQGAAVNLFHRTVPPSSEPRPPDPGSTSFRPAPTGSMITSPSGRNCDGLFD
jgi:hypothetical protein